MQPRMDLYYKRILLHWADNQKERFYHSFTLFVSIRVHSWFEKESIRGCMVKLGILANRDMVPL
jgi:hypothetical protein